MQQRMGKIKGRVVTLVPDSGTNQLAGISGKMEIVITEGRQSYEFDRTLTELP